MNMSRKNFIKTTALAGMGIAGMRALSLPSETVLAQSSTEPLIKGGPQLGQFEDDLSGFRKLDFGKPPIGVKFLFFRPEEMEQLDSSKNLSLCEMIVEAQEAKNPFYFSKENNETCVGKIILGMQDMESFAHSGQIGAKLKIFEEPRANYIFYQHVPKLERDVINYVAFSPIDKLTFKPDILIISTTIEKAEIIMRAMSYSTGEVFVSMTTPVMGCAWTYVYPYKTGKINYLAPRMVHGMTGRQLFPKDSMLISIPYHWIPIISSNLSKMEIHLSSHNSKEEYLAEFGNIIQELVIKSQQP